MTHMGVDCRQGSALTALTALEDDGLRLEHLNCLAHDRLEQPPVGLIGDAGFQWRIKCIHLPPADAFMPSFTMKTNVELKLIPAMRCKHGLCGWKPLKRD